MTGGRPFTLRLVAFLAMTLGLLVWTLQALGAFSFAAGYRLHATFDDASGVLVGSEVQLAGVGVGRVERIELAEDNRARLTLSLRKGLRLPPETSATIRARSMLGEKLVALEASVATGAVLGDGDEITSTSVEADLNSLAAQAGEAMHGISDAVAEFGKIAEVVGQFGDELDLQQLTADLHAVGELARAGRDFLTKNESELTATLEATRRGAESLAETADRAQAPIGRLDDILAQLQQDGTIARTGELIDELRAFSRDAGPELLETLRELRERLLGTKTSTGLASTIEGAATRADTFFAGATELTARLRRSTGNLEATLSKLDSALDSMRGFTPREVRKILQEEGVKVILLD